VAFFIGHAPEIYSVPSTDAGGVRGCLKHGFTADAPVWLASQTAGDSRP